jgi:ATP-dependent RNA helicase DHX57
MPGAPEIDRLVRQLQGSAKLAGAAGHAGLRVLPLHGGLPAAVQARVFERPPRGVLKVVVATNVAETSLTIDDVTVVIDTGRHKEMRCVCGNFAGVGWSVLNGKSALPTVAGSH